MMKLFSTLYFLHFSKLYTIDMHYNKNHYYKNRSILYCYNKKHNLTFKTVLIKSHLKASGTNIYHLVSQPVSILSLAPFQAVLLMPYPCPGFWTAPLLRSSILSGILLRGCVLTHWSSNRTVRNLLPTKHTAQWPYTWEHCMNRKTKQNKPWNKVRA